MYMGDVLSIRGRVFNSNMMLPPTLHPIVVSQAEEEYLIAGVSQGREGMTYFGRPRKPPS